MSEGKVITCRAAVCWDSGEELKIEEIQVDPPSKNEVRVKIITTSLVRRIECNSFIIIWSKIFFVYFSASVMFRQLRENLRNIFRWF